MEKKQVFVLPPNLLQKLGINLDNVGNTDKEKSISNSIQKNVDTVVTDNMQDKVVEDSSNRDVIEEPSILKTAALMKESLHLSPTFNPRVGNATISCEIQTNYPLKQDFEDCNIEINDSIKKIYETENVNNFNKICSVDNTYNNTEFSKNSEFNKINEVNKVVNDVESFSMNNQLQLFHEEARSIDADDNSSVSIKRKDKVKIISEEILTTAKLRELKMLQICSKKTLVPASVKLIGTKICSSQSQMSQSCLNETINIPDISAKTQSESQKSLIPVNTEIPKIEFLINMNDIGHKKIALPYNISSKKISSSEKMDVDSENNATILNQNQNVLETKSNMNNINLCEELGDMCNNNVVLGVNKREICNENDSSNYNTSSEFKKSDKDLYSHNMKENIFSKDETYNNYEKMVNLNDNQVENHSNTDIEAVIEVVNAISVNQSEEFDSNIHENVIDNVKFNCSKSDNRIVLMDDTSKVPKVEHNNITQKRNEISGINITETDKDERKLCLNVSEDVDKEEPTNDGESDIQFEKVKEIALYLGKCMKAERKRTLSNSSKRDGNKNNNDLTNNSKRNNLISKLCIQGVEKPGGIHSSKEITFNKGIIKTYQPRKKIKTSKDNLASVEKIINTQTHGSENLLFDADVASLSNHTIKMRGFCVCDDFGCLAHDFCRDDYRHLHFSDERVSESTADLIFSIYEDIEKVNEKGIVEEYHATEDVIDDKQAYGICWSEAFSNNDISGDVIYYTSELSQISDICDHDASSDITIQKDQSMNRKHKRKSIDYHHEASCSKKIKAFIKCGVCDEEVKETKWEDHIADIHCYIAWKEGDCIDYGSNDLYKKLKEHLRNAGNLKCFSCGDQIMDVKDFLVHVEKCIDTKKIGKDIQNIKVECGVCKTDVKRTAWLSHIAKKHDYLAWKKGEPTLDLGDEDSVRDHLHNIVQKIGQLVCSKCGTSRKYAKIFMQHMKQCKSLPVQNSSNMDVNVKCAVCNKDIQMSLWIEHIAKEHNYIAWTDRDTPLNLDDFDQLRAHLSKILKVTGALKCVYCGFIRKHPKAFLLHTRNCNRKMSYTVLNTSLDVNTTLDESTAVDEDSDTVQCGVCKQEVMSHRWTDHILKLHNYQAWREGETPLDLEDEESVRTHLYSIAQQFGGLICAKCGIVRKYVKSYLQHLENCEGPSDHNTTLEISCAEDFDTEASKTLKCGVCKEELKTMVWMEHIQKLHNYQAWHDGEKPLDLKNEDAVRQHLMNIVRKVGVLTCNNCTKSFKNVGIYLQHIENCKGISEADLDSTDCDLDETRESIKYRSSTKESNVKCGVCGQEVESVQWIEHIQKMHNYQAWQEGKKPLDLENEDAIQSHLQVFLLKTGKLVCGKCGLSRKFVKLYLQHIKSCDGPSKKTDTTQVKCALCKEEMDQSQWNSHIAKSHNYLAWTEKDKPLDLDDYEAVWQHLFDILKIEDILKCCKCGKKRKYPKAFLAHIKVCGEDQDVTETEEINDYSCLGNTEKSFEEENVEVASGMAKCGVCSEEIKIKEWITHIQKNHNYLAWQAGKKPLDVDNEESVRKHLYAIFKKMGELTCMKCGLVRKKFKLFLLHMKTCTGSSVGGRRARCAGRCAVCGADVPGALWLHHIAKQHNYLAWREGDAPVDVDDDIMVKEHLSEILLEAGELICNKCGKVGKYISPYMQHVKTCTYSADPNDDVEQKTGQVVKCALCHLEMDSSVWIKHISKEHHYLAWKETDSPLHFEDMKAIRDYLHITLQEFGPLTCGKCGKSRKYAKLYMQHVEDCQNFDWNAITGQLLKPKKERGDIVRCAACQAQVDDTEWTEHIAAEHDYLAWRDRDTPINLDDEAAVEDHLENIIKEEGFLKCSKCGLKPKCVEIYLQHIKNCDGTPPSQNGLQGSNLLDDEAEEPEETDGSKMYTCGVCKEEVHVKDWIEHIQKEHNYLAWRKGKKSLNLDDPDAVHRHLHAMSLKCNGLTCNKCGLVRKYVKSYLNHVENCTSLGNCNEIYECGVCAEKVPAKDWREHALRQHYNIAWVVGEEPINLRSFGDVEKYIKGYMEFRNKMVCNTCGASRASSAGFYAHVLTCGKTDEEVDSFKDVCDICNQKYLCIYKHQHYATHRVQELMKERKLQAQKKEVKVKEEDNLAGRRRAAEKARSAIETYSVKTNYYGSKCETCGFDSEKNNESERRDCCKAPDVKMEDFSDSDVSIKLEDYSDEESEESNLESSLSEEEENVAIKKKRIKQLNPDRQPTKCSKLPYPVKDVDGYIRACADEYLKTRTTEEIYFPEWNNCNYDVISKEMLPKYMPPLEESCKVKISDQAWTSYKKFEAKEEYGYSLFTGGCIQGIAWAPVSTSDKERSYLAIICHPSNDSPRLHCTDVREHPALLQIWDFGIFRSLPKLAFGLAHDYGITWAIDWCPSGARDVLEETKTQGHTGLRLGLLAMACSNGSAYIFPVPYPDDKQESDIIVYKIKPCVELKLTRGNNKYQATSINWTVQKGHTTVIVGYGDGTSAMYDLTTESPLLSNKEGDRTILYPFHDERVHNSCVTGMASGQSGAWCSASVTGAAARAGAHQGGQEGALGGQQGAPGRAPRALVPLAASSVVFTPHWASVLLSGDDTIVGHSASEVEWGGAGRRLGGVRALAACGRRARLAAAMPPLLQTLRPHPVHSQRHKSLHKKTVAMIDIVPIAKKRSKHINDELSMKLEPITYEEAVKSHGIEFKRYNDLDKALVQKILAKPREPYPERFPLADIPAMAYCPSRDYYKKLAVATHAGVLFLVDV